MTAVVGEPAPAVSFFPASKIYTDSVGTIPAVSLADVSQGGIVMLMTIVAVLVILWVLGMVTSYGGGLLHLLLVLAIVIILVRVIQGRKPV